MNYPSLTIHRIIIALGYLGLSKKIKIILRRLNKSTSKHIIRGVRR